ncbi:SGNH/GDSL hydrolase family protein [Hyunsoonleella aestuarii]|uniref:SGNH/GDSL hydrolase family protein n=1 Tax=Hyunsoonleella aestuarii TaxID=912802 RepID=A0ABP8E730_9FLAO|nr:SGNH/GDSL hydrolase family protein [Hyunsoonleella aestuarii]
MINRIFNLFKSKNKIFVFGDSHARVFEYINNKNILKQKIEVLSIGGATAYGLTNPRSKTNALELFKEKINTECSKKDSLFFFLGEVDCGFVIWYRAKKYNESIDFQFERSLGNYENFLVNLKKEGFKNLYIIETVLPTIFDGFKGEIAHERREVVASIEERTLLTLKYNSRLKDISAINGFGFVKITDELIDKKTGVVKLTLLNDDKTNHHLNNYSFAPLILKKIKNALEKK